MVTPIITPIIMNNQTVSEPMVGWGALGLGVLLALSGVGLGMVGFGMARDMWEGSLVDIGLAMVIGVITIGVVVLGIYTIWGAF